MENARPAPGVKAHPRSQDFTSRPSTGKARWSVASISPTSHFDRGLTVRVSLPPAESRANFNLCGDSAPYSSVSCGEIENPGGRTGVFGMDDQPGGFDRPNWFPLWRGGWLIPNGNYSLPGFGHSLPSLWRQETYCLRRLWKPACRLGRSERKQAIR